LGALGSSNHCLARPAAPPRPRAPPPRLSRSICFRIPPPVRSLAAGLERRRRQWPRPRGALTSARRRPRRVRATPPKGTPAAPPEARVGERIPACSRRQSASPGRERERRRPLRLPSVASRAAMEAATPNLRGRRHKTGLRISASLPSRRQKRHSTSRTCRQLLNACCARRAAGRRKIPATATSSPPAPPGSCGVTAADPSSS